MTHLLSPDEPGKNQDDVIVINVARSSACARTAHGGVTRTKLASRKMPRMDYDAHFAW